MPSRDLHHDAVVQALQRDGWTITDDPLRIPYGTRNVYVDLGAENLLAAEKGDRRIAVEIKGFSGSSEVRDLEIALGQFVLYRDLLSEVEPDRQLYLAVPAYAYEDVFTDTFGQLVIKKQQLRFIVFDENEAEVLAWHL